MHASECQTGLTSVWTGFTPRELQLRICDYLDETALCRLAQTGREWNQTASDGFVWKPLYERRFGAVSSVGDGAAPTRRSIIHRCTSANAGLDFSRARTSQKATLRSTGRSATGCAACTKATPSGATACAWCRSFRRRRPCRSIRPAAGSRRHGGPTRLAGAAAALVVLSALAVVPLAEETLTDRAEPIVHVTVWQLYREGCLQCLYSCL